MGVTATSRVLLRSLHCMNVLPGIRRCAGAAFVGLICFQVSSQPVISQQSESPAAVSPNRALLNRYCSTCHNERLRTAELLLDQANVDDVSESAPVWEKVVRKLRAGQMPPARMPRPDAGTLAKFATYLETELDRAALADPNPGRIGIHRLNRAEYTNAIRDLLALEINGESLLPPDDSEYGFDNIARTLSVSPLLMERYMSAARKISRLAVANPEIRPAAETYGLPRYLAQEDRRNEELPFGSRGGAAIHHHFPLDGEYLVKVTLQRNRDGYIRGLRDPHQLDVRLDGERIKLFTVGGERLGRSSAIFPRNNRDNRGDAEQVEYEYWADETLEVRFPVKAGTRLIQIAFLKETTVPEGVLMPKLVYADMGQYKGGDPAVDSVTVTGPFDGKQTQDIPSRRRIFQCIPARSAEEEACARQILSTLARRAYRRPVTEQDVEPLMTVYRAARQDGHFETGIEVALQRILAAPKFLFRVVLDPPDVEPDTSYRLSDVDLASRLSFFLWSSIPDDKLLDLAVNGELRQPAVLEQQVRRMLADPRSKSLIENFAGQWLYLRNVRSANPDTRFFPDFDDDLREAMLMETQLFLQDMLEQDRSVLELLTSDHTFLNERLARHYGIPGVYGSHFRRVELSEVPERRGLLGQGSILMVTSYGNRTSPVKRGQWVLKQLLGTPPPPPPPDVANTLEGVEKERKEDGRPLTIREQMELHRASPRCAGCHALMDPIGFALENFDAVGQFRKTYDGGVPVDSSGVFYDGTAFEGPVEFRGLLLTKQEAFVRNLAAQLLTYALGREIEYFDGPAIRKIVRDAAPNNYRWSSFILGIVNSTPFQMRRSPKS